MKYFNDYIRSPAQTQDSIRKSLNRVDITKKDEEKQFDPELNEAVNIAADLV